jgi:hypothetical protein
MIEPTEIVSTFSGAAVPIAKHHGAGLAAAVSLALGHAVLLAQF